MLILKFAVTVKHDAGTVVINTFASNAEGAKEIVMRAERCPERAIRKIAVVPTRAGFLKRDVSIPAFNRWTIVDMNGDRLADIFGTKREARKQAKQRGILLCEHVTPDFFSAYLYCALWSSNDDDGTPFDESADASDIATETVLQQAEQCEDFCRANAALLAEAFERYNVAGYTPEAMAGHDFWLTRNGHGAGFWDRGLNEIGDKLTEASKVYSAVDLYRGDDGKIYA